MFGFVDLLLDWIGLDICCGIDLIMNYSGWFCFKRCFFFQPLLSLLCDKVQIFKKCYFLLMLIGIEFEMLGNCVWFLLICCWIRLDWIWHFLWN